MATSTSVMFAPGEPVMDVNQKLTVSVEPGTSEQATVNPAVLVEQVGGFCAEKVW
jgi:hypothetical protein